MKKSYHEHCQEEHNEALQALRHAKNKTEKNIQIVVLIASRKTIFSVPERRLTSMINLLKKRGRILEINGEPYQS